MALVFIDHWSENHHLFLVLEASKLYYPANSKLKLKSSQVLTSTATADLLKLFKYSQEFYPKMQVLMLTKWSRDWLPPMRQSQADWMFWQDKLTKYQTFKFTITEKPKNGPSDWLLNRPLQFWRLIKLLSPSLQGVQKCNNKIQLTMKIDRFIVCICIYLIFNVKNILNQLLS